MKGAVRKKLIVEAERLAAALGAFRTPVTGEPVDPSRVEELSRFLRMSGSVAELKDFLALLPTSFHAKMSRSAPPQLQEIAKQVRPLLDRVKETDQMLYLLGWTRRLLATGEREGRTRSESEPTRSAGARR